MDLKQMGLNSGGGAFHTRVQRTRGFVLIARELRAMGHVLPSARSIKEIHVQKLVAKWKADGLATGTIKNRLSWMRTWSANVAAYTLLSVKQLQAAGAGRDLKHLRTLVNDLHRRKLVRRLPDENRKDEAAVKARFTLASGAIQLLVIEVYTGGWQSRVDHFRGQLTHLATVAALGVPEKHWRLDQLGRAARYLILFRTAAMREEALSRWEEPAHPLWDRFFIKSLDDLADFNGGWWQTNGARRALFHDLPA